MFGLKQVVAGDWLGLWHAFQAPLLGGGVALVLALLGRWRASSWLLALAGGAGVLTGWLLAGGGVAAALGAGPRDLVNRLPHIALGAGVLANLGFEKIGLDLYVVAALAILSAFLFWKRGKQPLFIYYTSANWLGLIGSLIAQFLR